MKIGALVVTYNRCQLLAEVVEALREQTFGRESGDTMQIIVVNNGSTDETSQWLAGQSDIVSIEQQNVGGAGGFHTGLRYIAENDYDACWLMDDDVVCRPDALSELVDAWEVVPDAGFLCSKVVGIDGRPMNVPMVDQRQTAENYQDWMQHIDRMMIKVEASTFVSVLVPTAIICQVGLPYREYFIWGDDSEYTMRITRRYSAYMACRSVVVHKRAIQGNLSFETETNARRIEMFFYYFRNQTHCALLYRTKAETLKRIVIVTLIGFRMLLCGKWRKAKVAWKSQLAFLAFRPRVEYPKFSILDKKIAKSAKS